MPIQEKILKYSLLLIMAFLIVMCRVNADTPNKLPVIGSIVNIINLKTFFQSSNNTLDANIPNINYHPLIDDLLNKEINIYANAIIEEFFKNYNERNHHYTKIDYDVLTNNYYWFTLKINVTEEMASSTTYFKIYHIDKKTNKIVTLKDLFKDNNYKKVIYADIKKQMLNRMKLDKNLTYWLDDNNNIGFTSIKDDQNFYFNKKGELVIIFNEYEVGPGSIGYQEFIIAQNIYEDYLK